MPASTLILEKILSVARAAGASDVHLAAGIPPRMRVDGELTSMDFSRMLSADTLDILLGIVPQVQRERFEGSGEFDFAISCGGGRCRVHAYKEKGNIALALRLMNEKILSLEELGAPESVIQLCGLSQGLVLVSGPSGSGKSALLAALIDRINNTRNAHIITLEDPIEYLHPHKRSVVSQREIGVDSRDYASALRAALREDPDVILMGELCGCEAVSAAVTAAEMGHLIFCAVSAVGVVNTIGSVTDCFPLQQQPQIRARAASVLEAVVSRRLVPAEGGKRAAAYEMLHAEQKARSLIREGNYAELDAMLET